MTSAPDGCVTSHADWQPERLEELATRLFAALGYDGTSISLIAEAAGMSVARVCDLVGGKRELYLSVMDRVYCAKWKVLKEAVGGPTDCPVESAATLHRIADAYLDFCLANPHCPRLWTHRWLFDASDIGDLERKYLLPYFRLVSNGLAAAVAAGYIGDDVDLEFLLWSIVWNVNSFCQGGVLDAEGNLDNTHDPRTVRRFRAHLHQIVHRTMALPTASPDRAARPMSQAR
jgi:AcrR family transcriptional regulator